MNLFDNDTQRVDELVRRLERSWQENRPHSIEGLVGEAGKLRKKAVHELVATEIELRIVNGENARIENYLERFPELDDDFLLDLIHTEFRLRRPNETHLGMEEYRQRFPQVAKRLERVGFFPPPTVASNGGVRQPDVIVANDDPDRFRLLSVHDEGGLGKVWEAEDTQLRRKVAVKEIRDDIGDGSPNHGRFLFEALMTARLEHPGVVPVYAVGSRADGRPYYAMRFVRGESLQERLNQFHRTHSVASALDANPLELRRLLSRFVSVCNTIHFAHSQGVLHRDIKPANIMLGEHGETLVVDWGLAKVIDESEIFLDDSLPQSKADTRVGATMGSPAYMSPEQAGGQVNELGPETDVYGLGATLTSLLTGRMPDYFRNSDERRSAIRKRLQQIGASGLRGLAEPLAAICDRATQQDAAQRYSTARELGEDVERCLAYEPLTTYKESVWERAGRMIRRNETLVRAAMVTAVLVSAVSAAAGLFANRQRIRAEEYADRESAAKLEAQLSHQTAEQVTDLIQTTFLSVDPMVAGRDAKVADTLDAAARRLEDDNDIPDEVRQKIVESLSGAYLALGLYSDSARLAKRGVELAHHAPIATRIVNELLYAEALTLAGESSQAVQVGERMMQLLDEMDPDVAQEHEIPQRVIFTYCRALLDSDQRPRAVKLLEEASERGYSDEKMRIAESRAEVKSSLHNHADAAEIYEKVYEHRRKTLGDDAELTMRARLLLARAWVQSDRVEEGFEILQDQFEAIKESYGPRHPTTIDAQSVLVRGHYELERNNEAIDLQREVLSIRESTLGKEHAKTRVERNNLAAMLNETLQWEEAIPILEEIVELNRDNIPTSVDALSSKNNLAHAYSRTGQPSKALAMNVEVRDGLRGLLGALHPHTINAEMGIAQCHMSIGDYDEAVRHMHEILEQLGDSKIHAPQRCNILAQVSMFLVAADRLAEAKPIALEALELARSLGIDQGAGFVYLHRNWAMMLVCDGQFEEGQALFEQYSKKPGHSARTAKNLQLTCDILMRDERWEDARRLCAFAFTLESDDWRPNQLSTLQAIQAEALLRLHQTQSAAKQLKEAKRNREDTSSTSMMLSNYISLVDGALAHTRGDHLTAERLLLEAEFGLMDEYREMHPYTRRTIRSARVWLAEVYEATGRNNEAAAWRQRAEPPP